MNVTYLGHSCFHLEIDGINLLFDPFITPNELAVDIDVDAIKADYILVSHGHEDHVADVERIAKNTGAKLISNYEIVTWFAEKGVEGHPMNHGGQWSFDFGTVKIVTAEHSSMLPDRSYGGNPCGFVITTKDKTFYYAGDTALTLDMQLIGRMFDLDFAFLPIGDNFTMGLDEAVIAAEFIQCEHIVGMHYDTFGYIKINKDEATQKFKETGCTLHLPELGNSVQF